MKLKKFLKMLDPVEKIVIWTIYEGMGEDEEPAYDGYIMDVPWYLTDYEIYTNEHEDTYIKAWQNKIVLTVKDPKEG